MTGDWDREAFVEGDDRSGTSPGRDVILEAVDEHGEEWVLEHWYTEFHPVGMLFDIPDKADLPFFDPDEHEVWGSQHIAEMYRFRREYRENVKRGTQSTAEPTSGDEP